MSLSREAIKESKEYLKENCSQLCGQKFVDCRTISACQLSAKADKFENRFAILSKFRLFVIYGKNHSFKIERTFNLLALRSLILHNEKELTIAYEDKPKSTSKFVYRSEDVPPLDMAREILAALKHYFPDIGPTLPKFIQIQPEKLLNDFPNLPSSLPLLSAHNFRRSYVAFCDYIEHGFRDEVLWDIERIYFTHHIHEIRLDDFSHLNVKDQVAIIGCAQFSSYFTGILIDGIRLQPEHIDVILNVVRRSNSLKSLKLLNCGLTKEFTHQLGSALAANSTLPLTILDLSGNLLDDKKNIAHLANVLPKLIQLKSISFADCGLSEKSIHHLAAGLNTGMTIDTNVSGQRFELKRLVLSRCSLRDEANELINFVSVCGSLRCLDLSGTGIIVDRLWSALKFGGLQLEQLILSGCQSSRKMKDSANQAKELFSCMVNLEELTLAGTMLSNDLLKGILQGLSNNSQLNNIRLNLDGVCAEKGCFELLEQFLPTCPVAFLSLRDNGMEQDSQRVLAAIRLMKPLQSLDIGGANFAGLKANKKSGSTLNKIFSELVQLISSNKSNLKELIISDARLGSILHSMFGALAETTIEQLDICNNEIGNYGARILAKALQMNTSIRVLALDRNQITADGFADIANSLRVNHAVNEIPYPTIDISEALNRPDRSKVLTAIGELERALSRNREESVERCRAKNSQKLMQDLNSRSVVYEVDASTQKKIIFHYLMKVISELDKDAALSVPIHGLVENFLSNLLVLSKDNDQRLINHLHNKLSELNVDVGDVNDKHHSEKTLESSLRLKVRQLIERFLIESAFQNASSHLDKLLTQPDGLRCSTFSTSNIDNSILGQFTSRTNPPTTHTHRPNSTLFAEDSPKRNGVHNGEIVGNDLVHDVVKSRPAPPRKLKNVQNGNRPPTAPTNGILAEMSSSVHSSTASSSATPPSPRLRTTVNQQLQHQQSDDFPEEPDAFPPALPQSTPPVIPRRNIRLPTPNQPPTLPPKPKGQSPTELRNHKTLVLPALETAREMFGGKDSDESS
ncbi:Carm-PH domain-containing protein [Aphelenchoides bicaudatus]|nr:Carm-PH domain-containing protein [Aphelenchoides bicaudatus]